MKLRFIFDKEKSLETGGHKDFLFLIYEHNIQEIMDTYYFALDNLFMPNDESVEKVSKLLIKHFNKLKLRVCEMKVGDVFYFPIDLSDQYVGVLIIEKLKSDLFCLDYGVNTQNYGWSLSITKFEDYDLSLIKYREDWGYEIQLSELIRDIDFCINSW